MKPGMVITPVVSRLSQRNQEDHKGSLSYKHKQKRSRKVKGTAKMMV